MTYDADYFIRKFEAIPEDKWCEDEYADDSGRCCALGHCGVRYVAPSETRESYALKVLFNRAGIVRLAAVNDGTDLNFPQPTPKARILAALRWIKEQEPK